MTRFAFISAFVLVLNGFWLGAQQLPIFSLYQEAQSLLNPAMLPANWLRYDADLNFGLLYRNQWTQVEGAPQSFLLNQSYMNAEYKFLIGATISADQTGPLSQIGAYLRAGYQIRFDRRNWLSVGLSSGGLQYRVNGAELHFEEAGDIGEQSLTTLAADFAFGATYYHFTRSYTYHYAGLSVPQTVGFNLAFRNDDNGIDIQRIRHYYALLGSAFNVGGDDWLEVSSWIKFVPNTPVHIDLNLRYEYHRIFWIGIGGANSGTAHAEVGLFMPMGEGDLLLGYGYDHYLRSYGPQFGGAHEFKMGYSWVY